MISSLTLASKHLLRLLCGIIGLTSVAMAATPPASIAVVRSGKPVAAILTPDGADDLTNLGTTELQRYLRILTGAEGRTILVFDVPPLGHQLAQMRSA